MSFDVNKSDGTLVVTITDGTVSNPGTDLSISIIGRGIDDYAENIAENHLHIMENFANIIEPSAPTRGQLWYDTNIDRLKVHDGSTFDVVVQVERDPTPKLAGNLDVTGFNLVEDGNVILSFASGGEDAVNWIDIIHAATGLGPVVRAVGSDTNVDLNLSAKGTGAVNLTSGMTVGGGQTLAKILTATGSLTFGLIASGGSSDQTIAVGGAITGSSVAVGLPTSVPAGIMYMGWVSSAGTVTIRAQNFSGSGVTPSVDTYRATVFEH